MRSLILVTHPGRQHSHQTALALAEAGRLAGYWAGVPSVESQRRFVPRALWDRLVRYAPVALPPERVRWAPWTPALRRLGDRLLPPCQAAANDLRACRLFDRWAARGLAARADGVAAGAEVAAVVACEISALATFRAARARGIVTLLDAPSVHHRTQDRVQPPDPRRVAPELHRRIAAVKDAEIALADHVLTVSELARQTYVDAGVPADRVHAVTLGADTDLFAPRPSSGDEPDADGFTFLFAGAPILRKGFDLLVEAFAEVASAVPGARLRLVGPRSEETRRLEAGGGRISTTGPLDQRGLAEELRRADCLVLPSRHDSFGMVVPEALAAGVPVLVSEMVGAKDLVVPGESGWIVPAGDGGALAQRMLWCAGHPREVRALRAACRRAAAGATWPAHHRRLIELLAALVPEPRCGA